MAELIGHRGVPELAPENTLEGARKAAEVGFVWIEVDVRTTADGQAVVSHDGNLLRNFGADAEIERLTLPELRRMAPAMPTLPELLDLSSGLGLRVNVEIKDCPGAQTAGIDSVRAALRSRAPGTLLVSSFSADILRAYREADPDAPIALVLDDLGPDWERTASGLGAGNVHLCAGNASRENCRAVKGAGFGLYVFTVNDPEEHRRLLGYGADGTFTDMSGLVRAGSG